MSHVATQQRWPRRHSTDTAPAARRFLPPRARTFRQRVKVNVVAKEAKPVVPEGCFNQEATLPCTWFAADKARCGMVPGART